jgi:GT2 family glycosyltransferase
MPSKCDISICISSYKARDFLIQCLESVYATPPSVPYEVIVVNDYSEDGTAEAVMSRFPDVNFSENPGPVGIAKGFNMVFAQAQGRYLAQISADVEVRPGAIDTLYTFMEAHPEAGMAGSRNLNPDYTLQPSGRRFPTLWSVIKNKVMYHVKPAADYYTMPYRNYDQVEEVDEMPNACLIIRRETYEEVGGLDENLKRYYDDIEWCFRIKGGGWKIYYVPAAEAIHHCYFEQFRAAAYLIQMGYFSELYVFKKHFRPWEFTIMRLVEISELSLRMVKWILSFFIKPAERKANQERLRIGWQTIKMALSM